MAKLYSLFFGLLYVIAVHCQPDDGSPSGVSTCLDLVFLFDVSCSISLADQQRSVDLAITLLDLLHIDESSSAVSVRVGAAMFHKELEHGFYLNTGTEDIAQMKALLNTIPEKIKAANVQCETFTHLAVESLFEDYFTDDNGDRPAQVASPALPSYPNVAVMFSDARTIFRRFAKPGKQLETYLEMAEEEDINVVLLLLKNNRTKLGVPKPPLDHNMISGGDPERLFDIRLPGSDDEQIKRLADELNTMYKCPAQGANIICADIIFAFDVSCSIENIIKDAVKYVAREAFTQITQNGGTATVSAAVFDRVAREVFSFDTYGSTGANIGKIIQALRDVNMTAHDCRTKTPELFKKIIQTILGKDYRPDVPNYLVMFYDGMTSPLNERDKAIQFANDLKELGVEIFLVKLKNNRGKDGNVEFQQIASSSPNEGTYYLFPHDSEENGEYLTDANKDIVVDQLWQRLSTFSCDL